ncbi:MAG TPA: M23 family metallopeptidase [Actinoplanes sp.]
MTAAVVAGVGVGAAAASATPAHTEQTVRMPAAVHTDLAMLDVEDAMLEPDQTPGRARSVSYDRVQRKERPKPVADWVNPLPEASVTSCFGPRWGRLHAGVDLAAPDGTPIRAAGAGVVVAAGPAEGYGNAVLIDHGDGYLTHYGHMSAITVIAGQKVTAGEQIGNEGSTGHSTGPHLHFEVHAGQYKNPIEPTQWMHEHGVDIPGCVTFTN